ncbi:MAG: hypothetical protein JSU64_05590 [candidate division WOR-3 bacterium]|nr:MAG: hypothetical protein JSU64_05590 [candidate division WOR-3 bacterium]
MSLLMALVVFCGLDVYFLKDSPDLLVRMIPEQGVDHVTLKYSFSGDVWGSMVVQKRGRFIDATIKTPLDARIVGFYVVYDDGTVDDREGHLYLYELSIYPRMLIPFSVSDLEVVIAQAEKKITAKTHVDEAITLLDYAGGILGVLPVVPDSPGEARKTALEVEVSRLKMLVGR